MKRNICELLVHNEAVFYNESMAHSFPIDPHTTGRGRRRALTHDNPIEVKSRIGAIASNLTFDPHAIDGDGDGLVQDGTPWERPALLSNIVSVARGLASASTGGTGGSHLFSATRGMTNEEVAEYAVPDNAVALVERMTQQAVVAFDDPNAILTTNPIGDPARYIFDPKVVAEVRGYVKRALDENPSFRMMVDTFGMPPIAAYTEEDDAYWAAMMTGTILMRLGTAVFRDGYPTYGMPAKTLAERTNPLNWDDVMERPALFADDVSGTLIHEWGHYLGALLMLTHPDHDEREFWKEWDATEWEGLFPGDKRSEQRIGVLGRELSLLWNMMANGPRVEDGGNRTVVPPADIPSVPSMYADTNPAEFFAEAVAAYATENKSILNEQAIALVERAIGKQAGLRSTVSGTAYTGYSLEGLTNRQIAERVVPRNKEELLQQAREWYEIYRLDNFEEFLRGPREEDEFKAFFGGVENLDFSQEAIDRNIASVEEALSKHKRFAEAVRAYGMYPVVSTKLDAEWDIPETQMLTASHDFPMIVVNGRFRDTILVTGEQVRGELFEDLPYLEGTESNLVGEDLSHSLVHEWGHQFLLQVALTHPDEGARALAMYWINGGSFEDMEPSPLKRLLLSLPITKEQRDNPYVKALVQNLKEVGGFSKALKGRKSYDWNKHPHVLSQYGQSDSFEAWAEAVGAMLTSVDGQARELVSPRMAEQVNLLLGMPEIRRRNIAGGMNPDTGEGLASRVVRRANNGARHLSKNNPDGTVAWGPAMGRDWLKDATIDEIVDAVVPVNKEDAVNMALQNLLLDTDPDTLGTLELTELRLFVDKFLFGDWAHDTGQPGKVHIAYDFSPAAQEKSKTAIRKAIEQSPQFEWMLRNFGTMPVMAITPESVNEALTTGGYSPDQLAFDTSSSTMGFTGPFTITLNFASPVMVNDYPSGYFRPAGGGGYPAMSKLRALMLPDGTPVNSQYDMKYMSNLGMSHADVFIHEWAHSWWRRYIGSGMVMKKFGRDWLMGDLSRDDRDARLSYFFPGVPKNEAESHLLKVREFFDAANPFLGTSVASEMKDLATSQSSIVQAVNDAFLLSGGDMNAVQQTTNAAARLWKSNGMSRQVYRVAMGVDPTNNSPFFTRGGPGGSRLEPIQRGMPNTQRLVFHWGQAVLDAAIASGKSDSEIDRELTDYFEIMGDYVENTFLASITNIGIGRHGGPAQVYFPWNPDNDADTQQKLKVRFPYVRNSFGDEVPLRVSSIYGASSRQELWAESVLAFTNTDPKTRRKYLTPEAESAIAWSLGLKPDITVGEYTKPWDTKSQGLTSRVNRASVSRHLPERTIVSPIPRNIVGDESKLSVNPERPPGINSVTVGGYSFDYMDSDLDPDSGYRNLIHDYESVYNAVYSMYGSTRAFTGGSNEYGEYVNSGSLDSAPDWAKRDAETSVMSAHSLMKAIIDGDFETDGYTYAHTASLEGLNEGDELAIPIFSTTPEMAGDNVVRLLPGAKVYESPVSRQARYGSSFANAPAENITGGMFRVSSVTNDGTRTIVDLQHIGAMDPKTKKITSFPKNVDSPAMAMARMTTGINKRDYWNTMGSLTDDEPRKSMYLHLASESMWGNERNALSYITSGQSMSVDRELTPRTVGLRSSVPLEERANRHGVSLDAFNDESLDEDDIKWSSNDWCLAKTAAVNAGDVVVVRTDEDGRQYVLGITRKTGPFTGAVALPGGMKNDGETLYEAAAREMLEEVNIDPANTSGQRFLGRIESRDWDPRFVAGAKVAGVRYDITSEQARVVKAGDDASKFEWISVEELSTGKYPIAFGHASWLAEAFSDDPVLGPRFLVLSEASRRRNHRLINEINKIRKEKGVDVFPELGDPNEPYSSIGDDVAGLRSKTVTFRPKVYSSAQRTLRDWADRLDDEPAYGMSTRNELNGQWARETADKLSSGSLSEEESMDLMSAIVDIISREMRAGGTGEERMARIEAYNKLARRIRRDITGGPPTTVLSDEEKIDGLYSRRQVGFSDIARDAERVASLSRRALEIRNMSREDRASVVRAGDGETYVVHFGAADLTGGVLSPSRTRGSATGPIAGNTRQSNIVAMGGELGRRRLELSREQFRNDIINKLINREPIDLNETHRYGKPGETVGEYLSTLGLSVPYGEYGKIDPDKPGLWKIGDEGVGNIPLDRVNSGLERLSKESNDQLGQLAREIEPYEEIVGKHGSQVISTLPAISAIDPSNWVFDTYGGRYAETLPDTYWSDFAGSDRSDMVGIHILRVRTRANDSDKANAVYAGFGSDEVALVGDHEPVFSIVVPRNMGDSARDVFPAIVEEAIAEDRKAHGLRSVAISPQDKRAVPGFPTTYVNEKKPKVEGLRSKREIHQSLSQYNPEFIEAEFGDRVEYAPVYTINGEKVMFGVPPHSHLNIDGIKNVEMNPYVISGLERGSEEGDALALKWLYASAAISQEAIDTKSYANTATVSTALLYGMVNGDDAARQSFERYASIGEKLVSDAKKSNVPKFGEELQRQLSESKFKDWDIKNLVVVRYSEHPPEYDENGNIIFRPLSAYDIQRTDGNGTARIDRDTMSFTLNHVVYPNWAWGNGADRGYVYAVPLADLIEDNPGCVDSLFSVDTVITPPPGKPLVFRKGSARFVQFNPGDEEKLSEQSRAELRSIELTQPETSLSRVPFQKVRRAGHDMLREMGFETIAGSEGGEMSQSPGFDALVRKVAIDIGSQSVLHSAHPTKLFEMQNAGADPVANFQYPPNDAHSLSMMSRNGLLRLADRQNNKWSGSQVEYSERNRGLVSTVGRRTSASMQSISDDQSSAAKSASQSIHSDIDSPDAVNHVTRAFSGKITGIKDFVDNTDTNRGREFDVTARVRWFHSTEKDVPAIEVASRIISPHKGEYERDVNEDEMLGAQVMYIYPSLNEAYISDMTITPGMQGGGIGTALQTRDEQLLYQMGITKISLHGNSTNGRTGASHWPRNGFYWYDENAKDHFLRSIENYISTNPNPRIEQLIKQSRADKFGEGVKPEELLSFEGADKALSGTEIHYSKTIQAESSQGLASGTSDRTKTLLDRAGSVGVKWTGTNIGTSPEDSDARIIDSVSGLRRRVKMGEFNVPQVPEKVSAIISDYVSGKTTFDDFMSSLGMATYGDSVWGSWAKQNDKPMNLRIAISREMARLSGDDELVSKIDDFIKFVNDIDSVSDDQLSDLFRQASRAHANNMGNPIIQTPDVSRVMRGAGGVTVHDIEERKKDNLKGTTAMGIGITITGRRKAETMYGFPWTGETNAQGYGPEDETITSLRPISGHSLPRDVSADREKRLKGRYGEGVVITYDFPLGSDVSKLSQTDKYGLSHIVLKDSVRGRTKAVNGDAIARYQSRGTVSSDIDSIGDAGLGYADFAGALYSFMTGDSASSIAGPVNPSYHYVGKYTETATLGAFDIGEVKAVFVARDNIGRMRRADGNPPLDGLNINSPNNLSLIIDYANRRDEMFDSHGMEIVLEIGQGNGHLSHLHPDNVELFNPTMTNGWLDTYSDVFGETPREVLVPEDGTTPYEAYLRHLIYQSTNKGLKFDGVKGNEWGETRDGKPFTVENLERELERTVSARKARKSAITLSDEGRLASMPNGKSLPWVDIAVKTFVSGAPTIEVKSLSYTKPKLRERLLKEIMAGSEGGKPGQWSARKAQLLAVRYREAGGGYRGKPGKAQRSLKKWTREKWTTSDGKPAIRKGGTRRYLPAAAWSRLTPAQRSATNRKKIQGSRSGNQYVRNTENARRAGKKARG